MTNEARMAIHWVHRIGAIIVLLVVGALAVQTVKQVAVVGYALLFALLTQITLAFSMWFGYYRCSTQQPQYCRCTVAAGAGYDKFAPRLRIVQS